MKELRLWPKQIIVPFEYLVGNLTILKLYFRFMKAGGADVPFPVLVARPSKSHREFIRNRSVHAAETEAFFAAIDALVADRDAYYLIDGNHRGLAATLCRRRVHALEMESDDDLDELERMVERGDYVDLPSFPLDSYDHGWLPTRLGALVTELEERHQGREILTLDERTERLADEGQVPEYMISWFRARRRGAP
jgi:hypothetical protein